ncbi:hypothetical protein IWQ60_002410 [Tieghemiomyces parasiticus]|uniref:Protein kinase domain-containing protein n=1 Tax=Tieghemiomyces parasiticus TaxID=78921 RepID=A0A9W8E1N0_9FUNG|nr:hypothetical protein IWQ60_002410 [Tieghemiomyces parasiticus]
MTYVCKRRLFDWRFKPQFTIYVLRDKDGNFHQAVSSQNVTNPEKLCTLKLTRDMMCPHVNRMQISVTPCLDSASGYIVEPDPSIPRMLPDSIARHMESQVDILQHLFTDGSLPFVVKYRGCRIENEYITGICFESVPYRLSDAVAQGRIGDVDVFISKLSTGLRRMHERGVIHDNMSSHSVRVTENGEPCIVDFGACKRRGQRRMGYRNGTLGYTRPCATAEFENDWYSIRILKYHLQTNLVTDPCMDTTLDELRSFIAGLDMEDHYATNSRR